MGIFGALRVKPWPGLIRGIGCFFWGGGVVAWSPCPSLTCSRVVDDLLSSGPTVRFQCNTHLALLSVPASVPKKDRP